MLLRADVLKEEKDFLLQQVQSNPKLNEKFEKTSRLLSSNDYQSLKEKSSQLRGDFFIVYYKSNSSFLTRLGITVPRKVGSAVFRNKLKRIVRELFRKSHFKELALDVNIVVKSSTCGRMREEAHLFNTISTDFNKLFLKLNMK